MGLIGKSEPSKLDLTNKLPWFLPILKLSSNERSSGVIWGHTGRKKILEKTKILAIFKIFFE